MTLSTGKQGWQMRMPMFPTHLNEKRHFPKSACIVASFGDVMERKSGKASR